LLNAIRYCIVAAVGTHAHTVAIPGGVCKRHNSRHIGRIQRSGRGRVRADEQQTCPQHAFHDFKSEEVELDENESSYCKMKRIFLDFSGENKSQIKNFQSGD
jgi:hypothetical protein